MVKSTGMYTQKWQARANFQEKPKSWGWDCQARQEPRLYLSPT
ncbi:hypothetical protein [Nostoc sp. C052]|nr:hypothetical protein [Nostoc sp. C052]